MLTNWVRRGFNVESNRKKLRSRNVIFMEDRITRRDNRSSMEFSSQDTETTNDNNTHTDAKDEAPRRRTRSEVWGTDPTRRSERITDKVLITKVGEDSPVIEIPKAYEDAVKSPEGKHWREAMDYELNKLEEMETWSEFDETDVPQEAQVLPGMWVHLVKNLESGERKFRSRWVVRGDKQKTDLSLSDTFAPVSRITSLRILLALVTMKNLRIFAWDVDSAYLHGKIDHDIFIKLPKGYKKPNKVGKLNKALYGLPEAARVWCEDLEAKLKTLGFSPLGSDTGAFISKTQTSFTAIDTHVDDRMGICSSEEEESQIKSGIQRFYKIKEKDTSKLFKVLGILVTRDTHRGTLKMTQSEYIDTMLSRFDMRDCNPVVTPMDKGSHLQDKESAPYENEKTYQALIGSLTYATMPTHPDIGYITQYLSQANKKPSQRDWNTVKRVLRYLKGTWELGIVFQRDPGVGQIEHDPATPWGYCDANYTEYPRNRKFTSSYVFMLAGGSISWKSRSNHLSLSL